MPTSPLGNLGSLLETQQDSLPFSGLPSIDAISGMPGMGLPGLPGLGSLQGLGGLPGMGLGGLNMQDLRAQVESEMMQNPEMLRQFINNPLIQGIVSDPENIRMFVTSNPQIRDLIDVNGVFFIYILHKL